MKPRFAMVVTALALMIAIALPASPAAQNPAAPEGPARVEERIRMGQTLRAQNKLTEAIGEFEHARTEASRLNERTAEAEANLQLGLTHQEFYSRDAADLDHLATAMAAYDLVVQSGTPTQRAQALNNMGTLYLARREYPRAVATLTEVDRTKVPPAELFVHDYNLGRAFDLSGNPEMAYPCYVKALKANPRYSIAAEKAFENLRASGKPAKLAEALGLARVLLDTAQSELAARETLRCLDVWGSDPQAYALLTVLVRHYTVSTLEPDRFLKDSWPALEKLASKHLVLQSAVAEIRKAFDGDFEPVIQAPLSEPVEQFGAWRKLERDEVVVEKTFAKLLVTIGNYYYAIVGESGQCRDPKKALARYSAASSLDPFDTEAALFTAALLRDYSEQLDPVHRLYDRFVEFIMQENRGLYAKDPKTAVDWANLMRMHYLLGAVLVSEQRWGSEEKRGSVIYQWAYATRAEAKLRELDGKYPPTPGLHQRLATAFKATQQPAKAFEQFLLAAEEFADMNDFASGKEALASARALATTPEVYQKRVDLLVARLEGRPVKIDPIADPNPDAIIDKAIAALGGAEKLKAAEAFSMNSKGTLELEGNKDEFTTQVTVSGLDRARKEMVGKIGDKNFKGIFVLNGDKGWYRVGDKQGEMDPQNVAIQRRLLYLDVIPTTAFQLKGHQFKVAPGGKLNIDGKPTIGLDVVGPDGKNFTLYFSQESGLPVRLVAKLVVLADREFTLERTYGQYKEFDGIKKATKILTKNDGKNYMNEEVVGFQVLNKVNAATFAAPE
jgi:tetratricopeptide (TPR) repeat protein